MSRPGRPTAVTLAGDDRRRRRRIAAALAGPSFRPYAAGDRIGVELCGALKNIYALAAGAVEGAKLGASARAGLIARAFAELGRILAGAGRHAATLTGLAGLGDLALTCTSTQSRNYRHGVALGRGEPPAGDARRGRVHRAGRAVARAQGRRRRAADRCGQSALVGHHVDRHDRCGADVAPAQTGDLELYFALVAHDRPNAVADRQSIRPEHLNISMAWATS